jgi:hypothetical protein
MFRLQVTVIRQTFQHMDMICLKSYTENVNNMGSHTVALNMSCPCTEMSA